MADRFPSLEDFSEGQTEVRGDAAPPTAAASDDFLARERALLGDDADLFASSGDHQTTHVADAEDDLLGGDDNTYSSAPAGGEEIKGFESSFPVIDTSNEAVAPGGTITSQPAPSQYISEDEPEVIRAWRERRDLALSHRADTSAAKRQETEEAAHTAIDDFYLHYNAKRAKTIEQTRADAADFLARREDTSAGGTSWERIAKLVDLSGKGTKGGAGGLGKERFRELLLDLKKDEHAPGAAGV